MEAPTPVSALMHAGVINAGAALLLLRFAPLVVPPTRASRGLLVARRHDLTASLGLLAMWAQVKVKRTLAWSTVAQMGFLMVQFGLGAFGAAIAPRRLGHGCYKARSFLRAGGLPARVGVHPGGPLRSAFGRWPWLGIGTCPGERPRPSPWPREMTGFDAPALTRASWRWSMIVGAVDRPGLGSDPGSALGRGPA